MHLRITACPIRIRLVRQPRPRPPTLALAVTASPLATVTPAASAQLTADVYAKRGDDMLAIRDISAARKYYEYAANAGSARAAAALARTLDPAFMHELGVEGPSA